MRQVCLLFLLGLSFVCCHAGPSTPGQEPVVESTSERGPLQEPSREMSVSQDASSREDENLVERKREYIPEPIPEKKTYHHCINISVKVEGPSSNASISGTYPHFQVESTIAPKINLFLVSESKPIPDCVFSEYKWVMIDKPLTSLSVFGSVCVEKPACNVIIQKAGKYTFQLDATNIEKKITRFSFSVTVVEVP